MFVTQKIVKAAVTMSNSVAQSSQRMSQLQLGNLEAVRDWGHAADYCAAYHLMILKLSNYTSKEDLMTYVVATD